MKRPLTNPVASIRARLLNEARRSGEAYDDVLRHYAQRGLLHRLDVSKHRPDFVVKGAALFRAWFPSWHRQSKDLDLLSRGISTPEHLRDVFREITAHRLHDGLTFDADAIRSEAIKTAARYRGVRLHIPVGLGSARLALQVDVGFGDVVRPVETTYPELLAEMPARKLRSYPMEVSIAEKVQAMTTLGIDNTRMKDFYDVWWLATNRGFDAEKLADAVRRTFRRRGTAIPEVVPVAFTTTFASDEAKNRQWSAFMTKSRPTARPVLPEVVATLHAFVVPLFAALRAGTSMRGAVWQPEGRRW